jgi:hypothetical protein
MAQIWLTTVRGEGDAEGGMQPQRRLRRLGGIRPQIPQISQIMGSLPFAERFNTRVGLLEIRLGE